MDEMPNGKSTADTVSLRGEAQRRRSNLCPEIASQKALAMTVSSTSPAKSNLKSRYSMWLRSVSLIVVVAFLLQDVVSAQGGAPLWSNVAKPENDPHTLH